jgi:hypothetical protein
VEFCSEVLVVGRVVDGWAVAAIGCSVAARVGESVRVPNGGIDEAFVGAVVGEIVGCIVGISVGVLEGFEVG